jgi:hypothetical protein
MPPSNSSSSPPIPPITTISPRPPRCPLALQEIFLASNAGNEVHTPPPANLASKTFQRRADWNFHNVQQQQQQQPKRSSLLLLMNPFSRASSATTTPTAPPPSLLGVSKSRAKSMARRIPLHTQQDALFADVLPNFSNDAKKVRISPTAKHYYSRPRIRCTIQSKKVRLRFRQKGGPYTPVFSCIHAFLSLSPFCFTT